MSKRAKIAIVDITQIMFTCDPGGVELVGFEGVWGEVSDGHPGAGHPGAQVGGRHQEHRQGDQAQHHLHTIIIVIIWLL